MKLQDPRYYSHSIMSIMLASQLHIYFGIYKSFLLSQTSESVTFSISHYSTDIFASTSVSELGANCPPSQPRALADSNLQRWGPISGPGSSALVRMSNAPSPDV